MCKYTEYLCIGIDILIILKVIIIESPQKTQQHAQVKPKAQISCAVTAQLISVFVFATQIVQSLFYLHPKFQVSSQLLQMHRPVYVRPGRIPQKLVFLRHGSYYKYTDTFMKIEKMNMIVYLFPNVNGTGFANEREQHI